MSILDEAVALAGVDPHELHTRLTAGRPEQIITLAHSFEEAGREAHGAYERGRRAHASIAGGIADDGAPVVDAAGRSSQAWRLLGRGGQDMEDTARLLKRSATALESAQTTSAGVIDQLMTDLTALVSRPASSVGPAAAAGRLHVVEQAAGMVGAAATAVQRAIDAYDHELNSYTTELAGRGYLPAEPGPPRVGHTTPRHRTGWWESTLDTAGDAGAALYSHTVVPVVNAAADVGQAMREHPADVAGVLLGGGMILLGGAGEIGGVALDATGVGAVAGVPINIAAAGLVVAGAGIAAMSAANLADHATNNDNQVLDQAQGPSASQPRPGDPLPESARPDTAGVGWQGRVADNAKGEVWQAPGSVNPPPGVRPTPTRCGSWTRSRAIRMATFASTTHMVNRSGWTENRVVQPTRTFRFAPTAATTSPRMEPVIPDFAGKTITIVKVDFSLYLWTDDNWVIQLAGPVLVSSAGSRQPGSMSMWPIHRFPPSSMAWSAGPSEGPGHRGRASRSAARRPPAQRPGRRHVRGMGDRRARRRALDQHTRRRDHLLPTRNPQRSRARPVAGADPLLKPANGTFCQRAWQKVPFAHVARCARTGGRGRAEACV